MFRAFHHIAALLSCLVLAAACSDPRVAELESQVTALQTEISQINERASFEKLTRDWDTVAYLTRDPDNYALVRSDLGMLAVSLADIRPHPDGTQVTLKFGNLTAVRIHGIKAQMEWGMLDPGGLPMNHTTRSGRIDFEEKLNSGSWTKADVVLKATPPAQVGFVRLSQIGHGGIRLR
ncbi:MAG: DUF3251 domain-containing protein [Desulfuromonadales bacterium]|nr:DUF3251 domain-containing protein [Desulfuromonadales bacterium]